ncbi:MAG TPA: N-acetylmuramoyl-L-alanine amidase, partial [Dongiaceae bacterium]|nr:N-acetylmuramoyl-L-alanine amidase [Dongiaceae bacterium]
MPPVRRAWKRPTRPRCSLAGPSMLALALALVAGCAPRPGPGPTPPPPPPRHPGPTSPRAAPAESLAKPPAAGYEGLKDSLAAVDTRGLVGRRIVIDPGHGGIFTGSIGISGTTEAAVNLGVALALRDRLTAAGARVLLTRDRDRDFLTARDSSLKADLAERARLANAFDPDLFISIHHNADAGGRHDVNQIQTYWKLGDDGPSLDAAQDVHRALVRNLGIEENLVVAGNYFVLRSVEAPAILTESSYLTYPPTEDRLRTESGQRLEADALFIGLARYFARPAPVIAELVARAGPDDRPDTTFDVAAPLLEARIDGPFDLARMTLDDEPLAFERAAGDLRAHPAGPLAGGEHVATLTARLGGAGASRTRTLRFRIARPVASLRLRARPAALPLRGGWVGLRVEVLDAFGLATGDSALVRITATCPRDVMRASLARVRDGVAWGYVKLPPARERVRAGGGCVKATFHAVLVPGTTRRRAGRAAVAPGIATVTLGPPDEPGVAPRTAFLTAMPGDTALTGATGTTEPAAAIRWLDRDGFACFARDTSGALVVPSLPGWRPWATEHGDTPPERWSAIASGGLTGKRIVIDPDGGGDDPAGEGPLGTRGALLALEEARILAGLLTAAGAEVKLTRTGDVALTEAERVQVNEGFRSDRFVRISHRPRGPWLGYYYASPAGRAWAMHTVGTFARFGLGEPAAGEDPAYVVKQVSCPALLADPAPLVDSLAETRLLSPGALRAQAYALYLSLAREFAPEGVWPIDSLTVQDAGGRPVAGAFVTLGGALVL